MPNTKWSDLNRDGRRLEGIIKDMNTKYWKTTDFTMQMAYLDRILKSTVTKIMIVDRVLGVKDILNTKKSEIYAR